MKGRNRGVFGAPLYYEDRKSSVMACIDQQKKLLELRERWNQPGAIPRLEELRDRWQSQGRTFAQVRIGITAGPMIVGNMGSRSRTDYTMMGDTVNLAARFESGQKIYGTNIMVNDQIYEQVKDLVEARQLDLIQVMGKEEPVVAYEVLERKGELSEEMMQVLELYNKGMEAYWDFDFKTAQTFLRRRLRSSPTTVLLRFMPTAVRNLHSIHQKTSYFARTVNKTSRRAGPIWSVSSGALIFLLC